MALSLLSHGARSAVMNHQLRSRFAVGLAQQVETQVVNLSLGSQRPTSVEAAEHHLFDSKRTTKSVHRFKSPRTLSESTPIGLTTSTTGSRDRRKRFPPSSASSWFSSTQELSRLSGTIRRLAHTATAALLAQGPHEDCAEEFERTDRQTLDQTHAVTSSERTSDHFLCMSDAGSLTPT